MRERQAFAFETKTVDEAGLFEGYASTFGNEDRGGDIVVPGAFAKTISERPEVPILWSHDPYELPLGKSVEMREDALGLYVRGQLNMETQKGREVRALMQQGALKGLSIGYQVVKRDYESGRRLLRELKLGEFSPCVFPMNEAAAVTGVKATGDYLERVAAWAAAEAKAGRDIAPRTLKLAVDAHEALTALISAATAAGDGTPDEGAAKQEHVEPAAAATLRAFITHTKLMEVVGA